MSTTNNTEIQYDTEEFIEDLFGPKEVRWYQRAAINQIAQELRNKHLRILVNMATGTGKTVVIAAAMSDPHVRAALGVHSDRKINVLFIAHKHRLLTQAEQTFADASNVNLIKQSVFSSIPQSVIDTGWDVAILDECHHEACTSIQYQLEQIGDKPIIGLSATPERSDNCLIKFSSFIQPISREAAVAEGWIAATNIHSFIDVSGRDKTKILCEIFDNFHQQMGQTLVFVRTKVEIVNITVKLRSMGYEAVGLLNQSEKELDNILNKFSAGEIKFIVTANKISEGIDLKGCTDIVLGKNVASYIMLNQIIGRSVRIDSESHVYELINPLSDTNLDTTVVVGIPESHKLYWKQGSNWNIENFDYVTHKSNKQLGIVSNLDHLHH